MLMIDSEELMNRLEDVISDYYENGQYKEQSGAEKAVCVLAKMQFEKLKEAPPTLGYYELDKHVKSVVFCKECRWNRGTNKCIHPDRMIKIPEDDDFCSYGERK